MQNFQSPSERLCYIREVILGIPRKLMAQRHGISLSTLYNWESGKTKITEAILNKYMPYLKKEGAIVESCWILDGVGKTPEKNPFNYLLAKIEKSNVPVEILSEISEDILMPKEVSNFLAYHKNAICVFVDSDIMSPIYYKGDYVCGVLTYSQEEIQMLIGYNCIVFSTFGCAVRKIDSINADGTFNLAGAREVQSDSLSESSKSIYITSAAEIILHRKRKKAIKNL